jgi:low temperature requirement protein LtrA
VTSVRRTALALSAFFYGNIPVLLGVIAMAAAVRQAVSHATAPAAGPVGAAVALGAGGALFLAGAMTLRRLLGIGWAWPRMAGAVVALATTPVGVFVAIEAQLAVITLLLVMLVMLERRLIRVAGRSPD